MKFKEYNKQNSTVLRMGSPCVSINNETGVMCFTREAVKLININVGDQVKFINDEDSGDWYCAKSNDLNGFLLRGKTSLIYTNNSMIARSINKNIKGFSVTYQLSSMPVEYEGMSLYLLIKKTAIIRKKKTDPANEI